MEVVIVVDLLVEEQAMLVEWVGVDVGKQLAAKDIANMIEDMENMADDIVDMVANMVGMVEGMVDIVESIAEMVSIVVVGNFGAAMAWVHSMNSEHTSDHVQEIANSGLGTYLEVEVLAAMVSLCP
jgi:methyl-accepting chemotaxis protein